MFHFSLQKLCQRAKREVKKKKVAQINVQNGKDKEKNQTLEKNGKDADIKIIFNVNPDFKMAFFLLICFCLTSYRYSLQTKIQSIF